MERVIELFEQIRNTSSSNEKVAIIRANRDNELFKKCLVFLLDDRITTGINAAKLSMDVMRIHLTTTTWETMMEYLQHNNTGTRGVLEVVHAYLSQQVPARHVPFYRQMITKTYRLGCGAKLVNKAIPGLIFLYETQQAYPLTERNAPKQGEWFSLSQKINGTNCGIMNGECLSRQGKPFTGMDHILKEIKEMDLDGFYINGELVRRNTDGLSDEENFQKSISIINSDAEDKSEIEFIFYEILTPEEFYRGKSEEKYRNRLAWYYMVDMDLRERGAKYIRFVDQYYDGTDQEQIAAWLQYADNQGLEGLMLNKDTHWQNRRNNGILKVKTFKTCDLKCIGVQAGSGKYENMVGSILCEYKGYELGVGSGFTDAQRRYYWNNIDDIVGKIVTVKYKAETRNQDGGISVQFPVFVCVRDDKDEESYEG